MKTTQEIVEDLLLEGKHINKFDLLAVANSVCLPQRILDIRQTKGWNISVKSIKGKGTLREYWLEADEISRIKKNRPAVQKKPDEQSAEPVLNVAQNEQKAPQTAEYEQLGLGLLGGRNY